MKRLRATGRTRLRGSMMLEAMVGLAILTAAVLPLGYAFTQERQMFRASYQRAVAMELVDGEIEILAAGEWRAFGQGSRPYKVRADATKNLPPGRFQLSVEGKRLRLEWIPDRQHAGGKVVREVRLP